MDIKEKMKKYNCLARREILYKNIITNLLHFDGLFEKTLLILDKYNKYCDGIYYAISLLTVSSLPTSTSEKVHSPQHLVLTSFSNFPVLVRVLHHGEML